ncbi:hypothetical protein [Massilia sp. GCM10023247]|uniref:hypothetical protein n=1 Tax=Massilia sp. GCM10023247 TaxID=3252643 RepID=UPI00361CBFED
MGITNHGLELMGFTQLPDGESISGVFNKLYIFSVEGLNFDDDALAPSTGAIDGQTYHIGFGTKLNAICNKLVDDDFIDDEAKWVKENQASAPFAIVQLGPTGLHTSSSRYGMEVNGELHTHDGFATARQEIKVMESGVIPPLLAALESTFSADGHRVRFRSIAETFYGTSPDGRTIHDFKISFNGRMIVSRKLTERDFDVTLKNAIQFASRLNPRVASFMHLGFQEKDRLKKFLNFFLSIEIETHATFKTIEHEKCLTDLIAFPSDQIKNTVSSLFLAQHSKLNSLKERFIWCVICKWKHLSDLDVETFSKLKKIRDDIAHGNISVLPAGAEHDAEEFVIKIQARR